MFDVFGIHEKNKQITSNGSSLMFLKGKLITLIYCQPFSLLYESKQTYLNIYKPFDTENKIYVK
jgi:hypothetical protein